MQRLILILISVCQRVAPLLLILSVSCSVDDLVLDNPHDPSSPLFVPRSPILAVNPDIMTDGLVLTWVTGSPYTEAFQLERRPQPGEYSVVAVLSPDARRFIDTFGVTTNVQYVYQLGAVGKPGIAGYSTEKPGLQSFFAPDEISISPLSNGGIRLFWNDTNVFPRSFVVERKINDDAYQPLATVPEENDQQLDDNSIFVANVYRYRIKGITARNSSPYSDEFKIGYLPEEMTLLRTIPEGGFIVKVDFAGEDDRVFAGASYALISYLTGGSIFSRNVLTDFYNYPVVRSIAVGMNGLGASGGDAGITLWNLPENMVSRSFATPFPVRDIEFSPDGTVIAAATDAGLLLYQVSGGGGLGSLSTDTTWSVAYSPDGSYVAAGSTKGITVWDLPSNALRFTLSAGGTVKSISVSGDGKRIAGWGSAGMVSIWEATSGTLVGSWQTPKGQGAVGMNPDGTMIAWSEAGSSLVNLSTPDGVLIHSFAGHGLTPNDVSFSKSGRMVASCSNDGTVRLWSLGNHWWLVP